MKFDKFFQVNSNIEEYMLTGNCNTEYRPKVVLSYWSNISSIEEYIRVLKACNNSFNDKILSREQYALDTINKATKTLKALKSEKKSLESVNALCSLDIVSKEMIRLKNGIKKFKKLLTEKDNIFDKARYAISYNNELIEKWEKRKEND